MKSFFKFTVLSALIISGKLAKQTSPIATAQVVETNTAPDTSVVLVHQVLTPEPAKHTQQPNHSQHNENSLLADMF